MWASRGLPHDEQHPAISLPLLMIQYPFMLVPREKTSLLAELRASDSLVALDEAEAVQADSSQISIKDSGHIVQSHRVSEEAALALASDEASALRGPEGQ